MGNLKHKLTNALLLTTNAYLNRIPSRHFRLSLYRFMGAKIGKSIIFRSTEVLEPQKLEIGDNCSIGWHCLLDAGGKNCGQCKY